MATTSADLGCGRGDGTAHEDKDDILIGVSPFGVVTS
jgi:hypothetical protein